ncbi:MAG TPA: redox-regulated ATPase YchF [Chthoniobacteraceae bacterium]|jgi:GTP-binding protein YchF|nr:GTP-binding protein YchF [Chthoniobacter sp.]HEV7868667.1 redox-regulated ATPase YchF [Chthoniobacteraceae bacterium]
MLSAGIVGLPNVGKSTLFNAVTRTQKAQAANYPFCTIDPNVGIVTVPDPRLAALSKLSSSKKLVPAAIEFVDIAGLVKGASAGEGLGNQFLSHIREVNAIVQVVRCFEDDDIHHVAGSVDPVRDIEIINTELVLADLAAVQKRSDRQQKAARLGDKQAKAEIAICERLIPHLDSGKPALTFEMTDEEQKIAREFFLLTNKPTIFACNVAESDLASVAALVTAAGDNETALPNDVVELTPAARFVQAVQDYARSHFATEAVVISAQIESELVDLSEEEAMEYLKGLGVASSGVGSLIRAVYHLLGLRTYLTTGEQETRAWTIRAGDKAPAAAGVIHSDFERGFIAAETVHFDDLVRLGSFPKAREAGKLRIEGKEYVVQDGDVVEFRFNV